MSENTSSETVVADKKDFVEDSKEAHSQSECLHAVDVTSADELFDSFMEIANDPQLHDTTQRNEECDRNETTGTLEQCISAESPPDVQVNEGSNSTNEHPGQNVTEAMQCSNLPQVKTVDNNGTPEEISSSGNSEVPDTKSPNSVSLDGEPVQDATGVPTAEVTPINDNSENELQEHLPTSTSSFMVSEKELICETESSEKSLENQQKTAGEVSERLVGLGNEITDNSTQSDNKESPDNKSDAGNGASQDQQKSKVAQRLSKAMEDLAGLERLLSTAVSEFKVANSDRSEEKIDEGEEAKSCEEEKEKEKEENSANSINSGSLVLEKDERNVQEIASQSSEGRNNSCEGVENVVCNAGEVKQESGKKELPGDQMEKSVGSMESDKQEMSADSQVQNDVLIPTSDLKMQMNPEESTAEKVTHRIPGESVAKSEADSNVNSEEATVKACTDGSGIAAEANSEKSENMHKPDSDVKNTDMPVPGIEITTTDVSEISEKKSLDSLDTEEEGTSNGNPLSPLTASDEGIDSDTASDYGDDDIDTVSDSENLSSAATCIKRKSWCLEINRDRLSSDSSTVSEKDFKEEYGKGDRADGKSMKEDYIRGHLLKLGGTGLTPKNWRKRWFVLRCDNCLYYYKTSKDKVPCGVIILTNYSVSKAPEINKNHCFKLTKGGARTYYMCAGSDSDMKKWMMAMMDAAKVSSADSNPFNIYEGNVHNVSIPALSIRDPDCHGYLYKQGSNYKIWRRRYFVLKNGFLYYYTDMSNTVALGVVKLLGYTIATGDHSGRKFYFSATSPDKSIRTYYFAAESEMDRTRWLSKLEDSIKKGSSAH